VLSPFPADSDAFGRPEQAWMLNLRVRDLDAMSTNRRKQQARPRAAKERVARQARRERAAELFAQGRSQAEVAREWDVSR
jgi:hypothetical protein